LSIKLAPESQKKLIRARALNRGNTEMSPTVVHERDNRTGYPGKPASFPFNTVL